MKCLRKLDISIKLVDKTLKMKTHLYLSVLLFQIITMMAHTQEIVTYKTAAGSEYQVYKDNNLRMSTDGYLMAGRLAKSYVVQEAKDLRPTDQNGCIGREYETSDPVLIAKAGSLIAFDYVSYGTRGSLLSMTIGNGTSMKVRTWGFPSGITFPNSTLLIFELRMYELSFQTKDCLSSNRNDIPYWQYKCAGAILGADANIPKIGLVKKGTFIRFPGKKSPEGYYYSVAQKSQSDGEVIKCTEKEKNEFLLGLYPKK